MPPQADFETEAQDRAGILDETNLAEDGDPIADFDGILDVHDANSTEDDDPEGEDREGGDGPDDIDDGRDPDTERKLDHGLKETFPASDPVSINPGAD